LTNGDEDCWSLSVCCGVGVVPKGAKDFLTGSFDCMEDMDWVKDDGGDDTRGCSLVSSDGNVTVGVMPGGDDDILVEGGKDEVSGSDGLEISPSPNGENGLLTALANGVLGKGASVVVLEVVA
jgi:hypothetical protein